MHWPPKTETQGGGGAGATDWHLRPRFCLLSLATGLSKAPGGTKPNAVCGVQVACKCNKQQAVFFFFCLLSCLPLTALGPTAVPTDFASGPASAPGASGAPPFPWGKRLLGRKRWHPMPAVRAGPKPQTQVRWCRWFTGIAGAWTAAVPISRLSVWGYQ
jgi:hypothetical protein